MEETNIFLSKSARPDEKDLISGLGSAYGFWVQLRDFVLEKYPKALEEWTFPGTKYGWIFRIKDKKRAIIYFLPRDQYFKVALVFGQKATDTIMDSDIAPDIKKELGLAKKYAEGRGIRLIVINDLNIPDIKKLIEIKLSN